MKIAVRMDDITPEMDWKSFEEFKSLLDRYQIKPLIGVVPDNQDPNLNRDQKGYDHPEFWELIRQLQKQGWTIAMHGYRHVYTTKKGGLFPLNNFSEFAGLDYERQKAMLSEGKRILQERGIHTDIFMAPAHSYDQNTLRALKSTGFTGLTDGFGKRPYTWRGITFYPISFRLSGSLKKEQGMTTMVVHTNTMKENHRNRYEEYFRHPGVTKWISYGEYLEEVPEKRKAGARMTELLLAKAKFCLVKLFH